MSRDDHYAAMEAAWAEDYPSTEDMGEYEAFFAEMGADRTMATVVDQVMAHVPNARGRLLEFGCDNGILLTLFRKHRDELHGVDLNRASLQRGRALFPDLNLQANSGVTLPFPDDHFDAVVASAVLKHIRPEDRPALYDELSRVATHLLAFYEETAAGDERHGRFTFYRADFTAELSARFTPVHHERTAGYRFAVYRM